MKLTWKQKIMRMIRTPPARLAFLFVDGARPMKPTIKSMMKMADNPTRYMGRRPKRVMIHQAIKHPTRPKQS
jgi:hypothetical protein